MNVGQVTNQMLVSQFKVEIQENGFQATDQKGREHFLSDLRQQYIKDAKKKRATSKKSFVLKRKKEDNISDVFVQLDRAFPERALIRESQPGLSLPEIGVNVYCIISPNNRHVVNMDSKTFDRKDLEEAFGHYKLYKRDSNTGITISGLECDEIIEVVNRMIEMHK